MASSSIDGEDCLSLYSGTTTALSIFCALLFAALLGRNLCVRLPPSSELVAFGLPWASAIRRKNAARWRPLRCVFAPTVSTPRRHHETWLLVALLLMGLDWEPLENMSRR